MLADEIVATKPSWRAALNSAQRFTFMRDATATICTVAIPNTTEWRQCFRMPFVSCWFEYHGYFKDTTGFLARWHDDTVGVDIFVGTDFEDAVRLRVNDEGIHWCGRDDGDYTFSAATAIRTVIALNTGNLFDRRETTPAGNAKRMRRGTVPLFSHHLCQLRGASAAQRGDATGDAGTRAHLVRGHMKQRKTGPFFWRPFARGNAALGIVTKDYLA